jgi:hypothetical protein
MNKTPAVVSHIPITEIERVFKDFLAHAASGGQSHIKN